MRTWRIAVDHELLSEIDPMLDPGSTTFAGLARKSIFNNDSGSLLWLPTHTVDRVGESTPVLGEGGSSVGLTVGPPILVYEQGLLDLPRISGLDSPQILLALRCGALGVLMNVPTFDIFSGARDGTDRDAVWLEAVEGLGMAYDRMVEIAAKSPGRYFIFYGRTHTIIGSIDTLDSNVKRRGAA